MKTYYFILLLGIDALGAQDLTPRELFFAAPAIKARASAPSGRRPVPAQKQSDPSEEAKSAANHSVPAVIPAAYISSQPPLGLRYSLLLSRAKDPYREVDAGSTFRSGDRLKITVEANDDAYLYVISRGSSGLWKVLFPISEVANGDNLIQPFRRYEVPNGGRFYFDDQAGEEQLFLVLSRKPEKNFEDLIYSFTQPTPGAVRPAVGAPVQLPAAKTFQVAGLTSPIDDALVGKVRGELMARDLVFEKVDDTKPGPSQQKETAVYVVNKNAGPNGKVIVDLKMEHQ
jgi:hypothetical protein